MRRFVGHVTPEEKDSILRLFERKNGLSELIKIIPVENNDLYEKVVVDFSSTNMKFQQWWEEMAQKYGWESVDGGSWEIDFQTCEVFLNV